MYPNYPTTAISTLLPENFDHPDSQPELNEINRPKDLAEILQILQYDYPWLTNEEILYGKDSFSPHISKIINDIDQSFFVFIYERLIKNDD